MSYNLTIDQGNTAAKIAVWDGNQLVALAIEPELNDGALTRITEDIDQTIESAIFCSVAQAGRSIERLLKPYARRILHLSSEMPLPITIDYGTPGTLGEDRIAAAVGAWSLFPNQSILVVDAGTAVTYDAVTADGRFAGGNIAPGITMRLSALHRYTARLPLLKMPHTIGTKDFLGHDTASAMILGAVYDIVGSVTYYLSRLPEGTKVVMTGGWARELSKLCDFDIEVDPDLASKGLNRILTYNENI